MLLMFVCLVGFISWQVNRRHDVVQWRKETASQYDRLARRVAPNANRSVSAHVVLEAAAEWQDLAQRPAHKRAWSSDLRTIAATANESGNAIVREALRQLESYGSALSIPHAVQLAVASHSIARHLGASHVDLASTVLSSESLGLFPRILGHLTNLSQVGIPLSELELSSRIASDAAEIAPDPLLAEELYDLRDQFEIRARRIRSAVGGDFGTWDARLIGRPELREAFALHVQSLLATSVSLPEFSARGATKDTLWVRSDEPAERLSRLFLSRDAIRTRMLDLGFVAIHAVGNDSALVTFLGRQSLQPMKDKNED